MTKSGRHDSEARPPRVRLAGTVLSLILLENGRQLRGKLHQLSTTGGLLQLQQPLDEGICVEVLFHVGTSTIRSKAVVRFPMWATTGCLQPFEFADISEEYLGKLQLEVQKLLARSSAGAIADQTPVESAAN